MRWAGKEGHGEKLLMLLLVPVQIGVSLIVQTPHFVVFTPNLRH